MTLNRRRRRDLVAVALVGMLSTGCVAEHTGRIPGDNTSGIPVQPPESGPFAGHYGTGCLTAKTSYHTCSQVLDLLEDAINPQDDRIQRNEIDVSSGIAKGVGIYWSSDPEMGGAQTSAQGGLPWNGMKLVSQGPNFEILKGMEPKTLGAEARISFAVSPQPGPHGQKIIVTVEITKPLAASK
jgi:hypothetical protein